MSLHAFMYPLSHLTTDFAGISYRERKVKEEHRDSAGHKVLTLHATDTVPSLALQIVH